MAIYNGQAFWAFDPTEDIVSDRQEVTTGLWSSAAGTLLAANTSSVQVAASGQYYIDVYNVPVSSTTITPEVQFSIAYGHKFGSGSSILNSQYPSRAIYSQYKNILLEPTDEYFTIDGVNTNQILVINFGLNRIKQTLDPGNWQLTLSGSNSTFLTLVDDSGQNLGSTFGHSGRIFNIVSGTVALGYYGTTSTIKYGVVYPDLGIMIFDPVRLSGGSTVAGTLVGSGSAFMSASVSSSDVANVNMPNFLKSISGSMNANHGFIARNAEQISSTHYFVRAKNSAFNFSNNPTFTTGSLGDLYNQDMYKNPVVYITTVGLYNDNNELVALAKLSQPLKKSFTNEALIRVKLDF